MQSAYPRHLKTSIGREVALCRLTEEFFGPKYSRPGRHGIKVLKELPP
jgi:hypothetical protein